MTERGEWIPIPPNPAEYLTQWLFEIGPSVPAGMGIGPIGWRDLAAWQGITGIELAPWEARMLRHLSQVFVTQNRDARQPDCPAPFNGITGQDDVEQRRADVSQKIAAMFGGLKGA